MERSDAQRRKSIKKFVEKWTGRGYEKRDCQKFWLSLLEDVFGVTNPVDYIDFESPVCVDHICYIDGYIPSTHVLIEQKSLDKDLKLAIKQSDGKMRTPFEQAKEYNNNLPYDERARYIVTCNFAEFYVYDMNSPRKEPEIIKLKDLEKEYYRLSFLVDDKKVHIEKEKELSFKAGEIVGSIYEALLKEYKNPDNESVLKSLNKLCVRLVFCLYAEDAGIFERDQFLNYLRPIDPQGIRKALIALFDVLDTKDDKRSPYLEDNLRAFPHVNGGLFTHDDVEIPLFTDELKELLLQHASSGFNWSEISPTIFGALFESTLNPNTRRKGGMHYTSVENIHKVIDPLFLDELKTEFKEIIEKKQCNVKNCELNNFQNKLASLKILDPACGSGNFLTESYISLRRLENEVIKELYTTKEGILQGMLELQGEASPIKVSIAQFFGIEINDFAVTVAKTALWIAESQMIKETKDIIHFRSDFLPLKSYPNIVEANALRIDWNDVVSNKELNYIIGNPPFTGKQEQTDQQRDDVIYTFDNKWKNYKKLDYVSCWYKKSAEYMTNTDIKTALVSTNSITQGEQVAILWKELFKWGLHINFAHRTFRWDSEAQIKAKVHCVIIGFSYENNKNKKLYVGAEIKTVDNINAYLLDAKNVIVESRKNTLQNVQEIIFGNMPNDGGYLSKYTDEKKEVIVSKYPSAEKMFKKFIGADEFLHNENRWCLWLKSISPQEIKEIKPILFAIEQVKKKRANSNRKATRKLANTPYLFGEIRQPNSDYLVIPRHSTENRQYIPIAYMNKDIICGDANMIIPCKNLYLFGILSSNVHMAWTKVTCGRIKSDYRYSKEIVYNNFTWCKPTDDQRAKIEKTAQEILDARSLYPNCSLADLYDELTMPPELRKAHLENDKAVMDAYKFYHIKGKKKEWFTELEIVTALMNEYVKLTNKQ